MMSSFNLQRNDKTIEQFILLPNPTNFLALFDWPASPEFAPNGRAHRNGQLKFWGRLAISF
jgi:hypothetical protein